MYPKFIELHWHGQPASINIDAISIIKDFEFKDTSGCEYSVDESYDDLKRMITDAGCIIAKADPRLDKGELTKEDIKAMDIGEPVWNSNTRKWYLISGWSDLERGFLVTLTRFDEANYYDESDLQKYPLYRMKVTE